MTDQLNLVLKQKDITPAKTPPVTQSDSAKQVIELSSKMFWSSYADCYHFTCMLVLILLQFVKIVLLIDLSVIVTIHDKNFGSVIFDSTDGLVQSPRLMALFTLSLLSGCQLQKPLKTSWAVKTQA